MARDRFFLLCCGAGGGAPAPWVLDPRQWTVAVNEDCRHYIMQTTKHEEKLERCRVGANEHLPFACPEGCVFYEPRKVSGSGWTVRAAGDS